MIKDDETMAILPCRTAHPAHSPASMRVLLITTSTKNLVNYLKGEKDVIQTNKW